MTGHGLRQIGISHSPMTAFVAFAHNGDPADARMPEWMPHASTARYSMTVDDPFRLIRDFHGAGRVTSASLLYQQAFQIQHGPLSGSAA